MDDVSKFEPNLKSRVIMASLLSWVGMAELKKFEARSNPPLMLTKLPNSVGNAPEKRFEPKKTPPSFPTSVQRPNCVGMVPVNEFLAKFISIASVYCPNSVGIVP